MPTANLLVASIWFKMPKALATQASQVIRGSCLAPAFQVEFLLLSLILTYLLVLRLSILLYVIRIVNFSNCVCILRLMI